MRLAGIAISTSTDSPPCGSRMMDVFGYDTGGPELCATRM
jgi:hypothetical protein